MPVDHRIKQNGDHGCPINYNIKVLEPRIRLVNLAHKAEFPKLHMGLVVLVKKNVGPHKFSIEKYQSCVSPKQNLPKFFWSCLTHFMNFA